MDVEIRLSAEVVKKLIADHINDKIYNSRNEEKVISIEYGGAATVTTCIPDNNKRED